MKTNKLLLALAVLVIAACALSGCDSAPLEPSPLAASPSPSPTPTPDARLSCVQENLKLRVVNGAGNDDVVFDYRETITSIASPRNAVDAALPPPGVDCLELSRVVGWSGRGPGIQQLGDLTGFVTYWKFQDPGDFSIIATHGKFKAVWSALLIRARDGALRLSGEATVCSFVDRGGWYEIHGDGPARVLRRVTDAATLELLR